MKIQEFLDEDIISEWALQRRQHLLCQEVCVVGRVYCLGYAIYSMGDWSPSAKLGVVLNIINPIVLV